MTDKLKSIGTGVLKVGGLILECHVLNNGQRLIAKGQAETALGVSAGKGTFARALARIESKSGALTVPPIFDFDLVKGGRAAGYPAESLIDICQVIQTAFMTGKLRSSQTKMAMGAIAILGASAKVGIVALIDEATGHQAVRASDALSRFMDQCLRLELAKWEPTWPESLVRALCRLYRKKFSMNPRWMGSTNASLYRRLMPELYAEMKHRIPNPQRGMNLWQLLTDMAKMGLLYELGRVTALAEASVSPKQFWQKMDAVFGGMPLQGELW